MPSTKSNGKQVKKTKKRKAGENSEDILENMDDEVSGVNRVEISQNIDSENIGAEKKIVPKFVKKMKIIQTQEISEVEQNVEVSVGDQDNKTLQKDNIPGQSERSRSLDDVTCQNSTTINADSHLNESSNKEHMQPQNYKTEATEDREGNIKNDKGNIMNKENLMIEQESAENSNLQVYDINEIMNQDKDSDHIQIDRQPNSGCHGNEPDFYSHGNQSDVVVAKSDTSENLNQNKTESLHTKDEVTSTNCSQESQMFEVTADFDLQTEIVDYITNNVKDGGNIHTADDNTVTIATTVLPTENDGVTTVSSGGNTVTMATNALPIANNDEATVSKDRNTVTMAATILTTANYGVVTVSNAVDKERNDVTTDTTYNVVVNQMKEIQNVTNQIDRKHYGEINQIDDVTSNIMEISAGGDKFIGDMINKNIIITKGGDLSGDGLTKESCPAAINMDHDLNTDKEKGSVCKDERNINCDINIQSISSENQKIEKSVETANDEITDSQLCALDWTLSEENVSRSSKPVSSSLNSHNTPVQEVSHLPVLPSGTTVVKGLIQQLSQLNMMILRTKREMESYRRQRAQKQQRRPLQTNINNSNVYK